MHTKI